MHLSATPAKTQDTERVFGTFGTYRYALALVVMLSHLLPGHWRVIGRYAVFGFFIMSGYIVSYILHFSYLPLKNGIGKYALNRALRIYPAFWIASLIMLAILVSFPVHVLPPTSGVTGYPHGVSWGVMAGWLLLNLSALSSVMLLGFFLNPTLMGVGWSLGVEICYWAAIPVLLLHRRVRWVFYIFTGLYTLATLVISWNPFDLMVLRYMSPMAGSLPFCLGMLCFLRKKSGKPSVAHWIGITAIAALVILILFPQVSYDPYVIGFYAAIALNTIIVSYLGRFDQRDIAPGLGKIDRFLGDMAYPIFLMHIPINTMLYVEYPAFGETHPVAYTCFAIALTNITGLLLHFAIETPLQSLRRRIKSRALQPACDILS